jgi:hypothetical protein
MPSTEDDISSSNVRVDLSIFLTDTRQRLEDIPLLHRYAFMGNIEKLAEFCSQEGTDVLRQRDAFSGCLPAHYAAAGGECAVFAFITNKLGAGATLSEPNSMGKTPAHFAVAAGRPDVIQMLGRAEPTLSSLSTGDADGQTPAHYAMQLQGCTATSQRNEILTKLFALLGQDGLTQKNKRALER